MIILLHGYDSLIDDGKEHLEVQEVIYRTEFKEYVNEEKIDGTKIQNEWFPQIEADIFISHSHDDKNLACALAGWIHKTFGLKCFIDSNVYALDALYEFMCPDEVENTKKLFGALNNRALESIKYAYSTQDMNSEEWEDARHVWECIIKKGILCSRYRCYFECDKRACCCLED